MPVVQLLVQTALMFQPRVVGVLMVAGVLLQAALLLTLSGVLLWSALVPALNPFDRLYDALVARNAIPGRTPLPRPGMQDSVRYSCCSSVCPCAKDLDTPAWVFEAFVLIAIGLVIGGSRFCFGSFAFHLLIGQR